MTDDRRSPRWAQQPHGAEGEPARPPLPLDQQPTQAVPQRHASRELPTEPMPTEPMPTERASWQPQQPAHDVAGHHRRHEGAGHHEAGVPVDGPSAAPAPYRPGEVPQDVGDGEQTRPSGWARLREYLAVAAIAITLSFLIKTLLVQPFFIPSGSMENTLMPGDRIVVNKLPGSTDDLQRGDVVVFEDPARWLPPVPDSTGVRGVVKKGMQAVGLYPAGDQHLVKRIIGVGGDHVVCCDARGRITVNGRATDETYLRPGERPSLQDFDITVPQGRLWMMGDNRSGSGDSREHDNGSGGRLGSVPEDRVTGRVMAVVWPFGRWGVVDHAQKVFQGVGGR